MTKEERAAALNAVLEEFFATHPVDEDEANGLVSAWLVVAEVVSPTSGQWLHFVRHPNMTLWNAIGMLTGYNDELRNALASAGQGEE